MGKGVTNSFSRTLAKGLSSQHIVLSANCHTTWKCEIELQKREFSIETSTFFIPTGFLLPIVIVVSKDTHRHKQEKNIVCKMFKMSKAASTILVINIWTALKCHSSLNFSHNEMIFFSKFASLKNLSNETKLVPVSSFV